MTFCQEWSRVRKNVKSLYVSEAASECDSNLSPIFGGVNFNYAVSPLRLSSFVIEWENFFHVSLQQEYFRLFLHTQEFLSPWHSCLRMKYFRFRYFDRTEYTLHFLSFVERRRIKRCRGVKNNKNRKWWQLETNYDRFRSI